MLGGAFDIEKLRNEYDLNTRYRMMLRLQGDTRYVDLTYNRAWNSEQLRDNIERAVFALTDQIRVKILAELDELYRQTGDYDSTAEQRVQAEQRRQQMMMAQTTQNAQQASLAQMAQAMQQQNAYANAFTGGLGRAIMRAEDYRQMLMGQWAAVARPTQPQPQPDRDERAMKLLSSKIGWRKMRQLKKRGYFEEKGKHGVFRFHLNTQGGVSLIERKKYGNIEREVEWTLCVQSMAADLPKGDVILSRWMEWKADENKFLDTANFRAVHARDEATQGRL